jgi:hypothetical protein
MKHHSASSALALAVVLLAVDTVPASAQAPRFPIAHNWTIPAVIPVVSPNTPGAADPIGDITIVVRDLVNLPVNNSLVVIDFSACGDVRLCTDPHDPAAIVDCASRTVRKYTDVAGVAKFRIVGCGIATPGTPGSAGRCARIYSDWSDEGSFPVAVYDLVSCDGIRPPDLSAWLADFFTLPTGAPRDDYDGNGTVGPADLSLWLQEFFTAVTGQGCGPAGHCP